MEAKLNELEERAEELDKKRTHTISSVSLINDRNRKANVEKAESAIRLEIKKKAEGGFEENPFQRKRSAPRLVTKSNVAAASAAIVAASSAANSNKSSAKWVILLIFLKIRGKSLLELWVTTFLPD